MNKTVQVICPPSFTTGGPEALHQLVHAAREQHIDARIVYLPKPENKNLATPESYRIYQIAVDENIIDSPLNMVIVPERDTWRLARIKRARKAIWWLSIDNFYISVREQNKKLFKKIFNIDRPFNIEKPDMTVLHYCQSEYAMNYLSNKGIDNTQMLTDYLRDDFIKDQVKTQISPRKHRVAYNPTKGIEVTRRIIAACPEVDFVRLENMSPHEVIDTLTTSTIYMDFGNHPGRDRIPREAAICGCIIFTGRRGSADNSVDVPIPDRYKFDESSSNFIESFRERLTEVLANPEPFSADFDSYRETIKDQKAVFFTEVKTAFGHNKTPDK